MITQPWWVLIITALIAAAPPTFAVLVALKRLGVVHTAVNSGHASTVQALADAERKIANLREEVGKLKEQAES